MAPDVSATHRDEELPGAGAAPVERPTDDSALDKARGFARAKRSLIAVAVAGFAVLKGGKFVVLGLWQARDIDQVQQAPGWALHHWLIVLVVGAAIFGVVFTITRFVLGKL